MLQKSLLILMTLVLMACGAKPEGNDRRTEPTPESETATAGQSAEKARPDNAASAHFVSNIRSIGPAMTPGQEAMDAQLRQLGNASTKESFLGYYTGKFGPNQITLILTEVAGQSLRGFSVCAGNFRPLEGRYQADATGEALICELSEPGDDPYDGVFTFKVYAGTGRLEGQWKPFQRKGNTERSYTLKQTDFQYQSSVGDWPEASQRILTEEDVWNYDAENLRLMRNEIYARHGYSFKIKDMRYHFEGQDWYLPVTTDVRNALTDVEVQNIGLIYEYETYYEEYYDDFGR